MQVGKGASGNSVDSVSRWILHWNHFSNICSIDQDGEVKTLESFLKEKYGSKPKFDATLDIYWNTGDSGIIARYRFSKRRITDKLGFDGIQVKFEDDNGEEHKITIDLKQLKEISEGKIPKKLEKDLKEHLKYVSEDLKDKIITTLEKMISNLTINMMDPVATVSSLLQRDEVAGVSYALRWEVDQGKNKKAVIHAQVVYSKNENKMYSFIKEELHNGATSKISSNKELLRKTTYQIIKEGLNEFTSDYVSVKNVTLSDVMKLVSLENPQSVTFSNYPLHAPQILSGVYHGKEISEVAKNVAIKVGKFVIKKLFLS